MNLKTRFVTFKLIPIMLILEMMAIAPVCDASIAFMANNNNQLGWEVETAFGVVDVPVAGHVAFGYQRDDGKFVLGSFGPRSGWLPLWAPGSLTVEIFDDWPAVERYLISNYYTTYKTFNVNNPKPQDALNTMDRFSGSYYNLLSSVIDVKENPILAPLVGASPEHPDSENCLTFAKRVLEAYGVKDLPEIVPFINSAPNNYFLLIPGEIHSVISDLEPGTPTLSPTASPEPVSTDIQEPVNRELPSGASIVQLATGPLSDGRPQSLAVDTEGKLWTCWMTRLNDDSSWTDWIEDPMRPSGVYALQAEAIPLSDGRLRFWIKDASGTLWMNQKLNTYANAGWTGWIEITPIPQFTAS